MEYSLLIPPIFPHRQLEEVAEWAEKNNFSGFWYPDEKFFRDPYVGLTLVAKHTQRINLGPCVTEPYSRHPILTAMAIGTLAEIAPGRTWLGIGAGGRGFASMGIQRVRPATAIRESVEVIRELIAGERVDFNGQVIQLKDRSLDFTVGGPIPIMIATGHGHLIQKLAGEIGDAAMLANYASEIKIQGGLRRIREGVRRSGRVIGDVRIISRLDVSVHPQINLARKAAAPRILSTIRANYPALTYLDDLPPFELPTSFINVLKRKDYSSRMHYANPDNCVHLIPDELYQHFSVCGNSEGVSRQLAAICGMDEIDEIAISPILSGDQTMFDCLQQIKSVLVDIDS